MDRDGSGYLDIHEMKELVNKVDPGADRERVEMLFNMMDLDGDMKVGIRELE